jgi:redox-sensitive bicupin YhaK (pirin superfamily)
MSIRPVKRIIESTPTTEGAGVKLRRAFGFGATAEFDPFLLLDDFRNDSPDDYRAGFPWHPHRGIETITYVLSGTVAHADSLGNQGSLGAGDVQWMTAGRGILHQEMPHGDPQGRMHGFQLWANLPSSLKMTAPRYHYSSRSLAMSFSYDKDQDFAVLGVRHKFVAGFAAPVRKVDRGSRIGRQNPQGFARLHGQPAAFSP